MKVTRLFINQFRNLTDICLEPTSGVNVISGENGQGKTNLLEAIWLFTGARSFRGAASADFIPFGSSRSTLELAYCDLNRKNLTNITLGDKKEILQNGVVLDSLSGLFGSFCSVVFSPVDLNLIKGGPSERRKSIDSVIGQIKPRYIAVCQEYQKQLFQRNTLLKDIPFAASLLDTLDVWDQSLAKTGALITKTRKSFFERLKPFSYDFYNGISLGKESLSLSYSSTIDIDDTISEETMLLLLKKNRTEDIRLGSTSVGPHRDDLLIGINAISAKNFGSQGQQRSAVLAIKLGECALIEQVTGEKPVVLLDDVMSELDDLRRDFLLHRLLDQQIFITCCDSKQVVDVATAFKIKAGRLVSQ
ncbi:MAG: DNA replication/repair protein RecF [Candidatus Fimivivens sp.]